MLAQILGITKQGNKGITNREKFQGLHIGVRGFTNRGSLMDSKSEQQEYKLGQRDFKSRQRLQTGTGVITNRRRVFKSGQGLQIGAEHYSLTPVMIRFSEKYLGLLYQIHINIHSLLPLSSKKILTFFSDFLYSSYDEHLKA